MTISLDRIREIIGAEVEEKVRANIKPYTDELFEQINRPLPNKLLGGGQETVKKLHNFDNYDLDNDGGFWVIRGLRTS